MSGVVTVQSAARGIAATILAVAVSSLVAASAHAQVDPTPADKEQRAAEEAAQRAREAEARRLGESIVGLREELAGRAFDPGYREAMKRRLLEVPLDTLREIEGSGARGDLWATIAAAEGSAEEDLLLLPTRTALPNAVSGVAQSGGVYVSVPPCRIVDTRSSAAGALVPGAPRSFVVTSGDFAAQGGNPSGCGVPAGSATSAVVNLVAVSPSGPGNLRAWAYDDPLPPQPAASVINYAAVGGLAIANGITIPLCDPLAATCTYDVLVQANANPTHFVADVVGYFRPLPTSYVAVGRSSATVPVNGACTHYGGAVVGIEAPGPGQVLVRANVQLSITHAVGLSDFVYVGIGASPTDCSSPSGDATTISMYSEPSGWYRPTVPISRLFTVTTPGTYYYYVNGVATSAYELDFWYAGVQATYHPR